MALEEVASLNCDVAPHWLRPVVVLVDNVLEMSIIGAAECSVCAPLVRRSIVACHVCYVGAVSGLGCLG
jgi:hypothetical protein